MRRVKLGFGAAALISILFPGIETYRGFKFGNMKSQIPKPYQTEYVNGDKYGLRVYRTDKDSHSRFLVGYTHSSPIRGIAYERLERAPAVERAARRAGIKIHDKKLENEPLKPEKESEIKSRGFNHEGKKPSHKEYVFIMIVSLAVSFILAL